MNLNPFWSMSTNTSRKRSDNEEQSGHGEQRASPARMPFGRKQLPPIPKNAAPITKPSPMGAPIQSANGTHASYGPFYLEYSLLAELYVLVQYQNLNFSLLLISWHAPILWFGVIFIRHGLYQDGVFKFTVYIPDNYPDGECPKLVFDIPVFHPLVDPVSGELDVRRAFTKWR
uniref:Akt interacting protein n=1 Tax=Neolamprologus brichardi TaxID=32507 RepID=A0A3Q4MJS0_NEOBR